MIREDFHVHTTFCDGKNTPEEMVCAAIEKGMTTIGFSGHSPLRVGDGEKWAMSEAGAAEYRREITRLKERYAGQIRILCGVEQDLCSETGTEEYDYVIGAVHCLSKDGKYVSVDNTEADQKDSVSRLYGGDWYAFAEDYYRAVGQVSGKTKCDIIAHFDLVAKFNEDEKLFDENHPRYVKAWQAAADRLLACGVPFEINTGAISRGYRTVPYPAMPIYRYLKDHGARFLLSSDSHSAGTLCFQFDRWEQEYKL